MYSKICGRDDIVAKYTIDDVGRKQGVYYEIDKASGEIRTMMEYEKGLMHGEMNVWGPGGSLRIQATWVRGKRHGTFYEWDEDIFKGYTEVIYFQDKLIEYSRYNYHQEKVDYEYYGDPSMNRLAAEVDSALWDNLEVM
jgi:antitoxin component YwqK of YwqJK toxin-antitoxin module